MKQLEKEGISVDMRTLKKELEERDNRDFTREVGPLKKAEDAIVIDSTNLSIEGVVDKISGYINK